MQPTQIVEIVILAMVAATWAHTFNHYAELPDRIPIHFGIRGTADNWGRKAWVWLTPAIQVVGTASMVFGGRSEFGSQGAAYLNFLLALPGPFALSLGPGAKRRAGIPARRA